jgi:adenylate cyclase
MMFQRYKGVRAAEPLHPIPALVKSGAAVGFVNIFPEVDGIVRAIPLTTIFDGEIIPSLAVAALARIRGVSTEALLAELRVSWSGPWREILLNFTGDYQAFPYYSYVDVLNGEVRPDILKDKIVLVGGTLIGLFDFRAVPNFNNFPGVEIHATALDNLLNGNSLRRVNGLKIALFVLLLGLLCGLLTERAPIVAGLAIVLGWVGGYFMVGQLLFSYHNVLIDFVAPTLGFLAVYGANLFFALRQENQEKQRIRGMFEQYVSPKVITALHENPNLLRLGGEEREMTVFFSDIADFTSLSESMAPTQLVDLLNEYFSVMTEIVHRMDGTTDKYIGDSLMAFWNAPLSQPRHAFQACSAALEQRDALPEIHRRFAERGWPAIDFRIGLHTGRMTVGNMGSRARFNYTVVGDAVNLASRLEGSNKTFGTHILISEATLTAAGPENFDVRELDLLRVKGKTIPIKVFELIALRGGLSLDQRKAYVHFTEGLAHYRARRFAEARTDFERCRDGLPDDRPSAIYVERCDAFLRTPPPDGWDGVYVMTHK